eukprot:m.133087 g.133087  ORF g.133087 m.133087 type:complete len:214 (-) comp9491_c0_seq3:4165-4806(-)
MDAIVCENCEEEEASLYCEHCDSSFCKDCGMVLHKSAKKKEHIFTQLSTTPAVFLDSPSRDATPTLLHQAGTIIDFSHSPLMKNTHLKSAQHPDVSLLEDWSSEDVVVWLTSINPRFHEFANIFAEQGIKGRILRLLNEESLSHLGIKSKPQQEEIINAIFRLRLQYQQCVVNSMLNAEASVQDQDHLQPSMTTSHDSSIVSSFSLQNKSSAL